jgi:hypothetical protein
MTRTLDYDYHDRRPEVINESPEDRLKTFIIKLGEVVGRHTVLLSHN